MPSQRENQRRIRDEFLARIGLSGGGSNGSGGSHHGSSGHDLMDLPSVTNPRELVQYTGAPMSPASFGGGGSVDERTLARRKMLTATLSTPDDRGLVENAADITSRLVSTVFRTGINVGFDTMTANVLSRGMLGDWSYADFELAWRSWDFCILRLYALGRMLYCGRIEGMQMGAGRYDPITGYQCPMQIACRGAWADLTRKVPTIGQQYTEDDASVTASQVAQLVIADLDTNLISEDFSLIQDTGVNIGPISTSYSTYGYDQIMDALRAGSAQDDEFYLAILAGSGDKCIAIIAPRGAGALQWRVDLFETGLQATKNLEYYASDVWASFTDPDGSSRIADLVSSDADSIKLHGSIRQQKTISLAKLPVTSAEAAQRAFLNAHADPIGYAGSALFRPRYGALYALAKNAEDGYAPAFLMQCGDVVEVVSALPADPILNHDARSRMTVIETTEVDWDAGTTTVTLDQRALSLRRPERAEELHRLNVDLAPWKNSTSVLDVTDNGSDFSLTTPATVVTTMKNADSDGAMHFELQADGLISIYFEGYFKPNTTSSNGPMTLSYEMDYEDRAPPSGANKQLQAVKDATGFSNGRTLAGFKRRRMGKGKHIVRLWAESPVGGGVWVLNNIRLEIWSKPS